MRAASFFSILMLGMMPATALAADNVSVERGLYVSIIGGCHDCHTAGYSVTMGEIDPSKAMKGSSIGYRGPWGTTYPSNLREKVSTRDEAQFVEYMKTFQSYPPMPWYNVKAMQESDLRSLYLYIKSLGEPGEPEPPMVSIGREPKTPYFTVAPPTMPKN